MALRPAFRVGKDQRLGALGFVRNVDVEADAVRRWPVFVEQGGLPAIASHEFENLAITTGKPDVAGANILPGYRKSCCHVSHLSSEGDQIG